MKTFIKPALWAVGALFIVVSVVYAASATFDSVRIGTTGTAPLDTLEFQNPGSIDFLQDGSVNFQGPANLNFNDETANLNFTAGRSIRAVDGFFSQESLSINANNGSLLLNAERRFNIDGTEPSLVQVNKYDENNNLVESNCLLLGANEQATNTTIPGTTLYGFNTDAGIVNVSLDEVSNTASVLSQVRTTPQGESFLESFESDAGPSRVSAMPGGNAMIESGPGAQVSVDALGTAQMKSAPASETSTAASVTCLSNGDVVVQLGTPPAS